MSQFTTIRKYFRNNVLDLWYKESAAYRDHVNSTYHTTGKILSSLSELDDDQLILTKTVVWASEEYRNAFISDPIVLAEQDSRNLYHMNTGITFRLVTASLD